MPGLGGGGGSAVTVGEGVGDVVAGAAGAGVAGVLLGGVPLEGVGGAVAFGAVVPPAVIGASGPGGEVARGGGQGGRRELADNSRSCPMASSRVPAGSPA
jgi:hypothetical protein